MAHESCETLAVGRRRGWVTLAAILGTSTFAGCAHRTDEATRRAWHESAGKTDGSGPNGSAADGHGQGGAQNPRSSATGWARVDEMLERAAGVLAVASDPETIARLAVIWCRVQPEPIATAHGEVRVCFPDPPVVAGGHNFSLEMGSAGVIGLVASDLTLDESRTLADEARRSTERWCVRPFEPVVRREHDEAPRDFHTCPVQGGPILTVGRLPSRNGPNLWQVSIALLGASTKA